MGKYIMALDQGTTSSRCIIYNKKVIDFDMKIDGFKNLFMSYSYL